MKVEDITGICKALGEENRLKIVQVLTGGEKCACELLDIFDITQPTLSHHMKILCDSGIVVGRKEGKWMHYSVSAEGAKAAADLLKELTTAQGGCADRSCCEK